MRNKFDELQEKYISYMQRYVDEVIKDIWEDDLVYWIIMNNEYVDISGYYVYFRDFKTIQKYKIPMEVCFSYWEERETDLLIKADKDESCDNGNIRDKTLYLYAKEKWEI